METRRLPSQSRKTVKHNSGLDCDPCVSGESEGPSSLTCSAHLFVSTHLSIIDLARSFFGFARVSCKFLVSFP